MEERAEPGPLSAAAEAFRSIEATAIAEGRLIEPFHAYAPVANGGPVQIFGAQRFIRPASVKCSGTGNLLFGGTGARAKSFKIHIVGHRNIIVLGRGSRAGSSKLKIVGSDSVFYLGAFSTVGSMSAVLAGQKARISIGDDCLFSDRIVITNTDAHAIFDLATGDRINHEKDVMIGDHVWIGRDVRVGKGGTIGNGCVIAQCAVVTGRIAPSTVAGGMPARPLRDGVTWTRVRAASLAEAEAREAWHRQSMAKAKQLIAQHRQELLTGSGGAAAFALPPLAENLAEFPLDMEEQDDLLDAS